MSHACSMCGRCQCVVGGGKERGHRQRQGSPCVNVGLGSRLAALVVVMLQGGDRGESTLTGRRTPPAGQGPANGAMQTRQALKRTAFDPWISVPNCYCRLSQVRFVSVDELRREFFTPETLPQDFK